MLFVRCFLAPARFVDLSGKFYVSNFEENKVIDFVQIPCDGLCAWGGKRYKEILLIMLPAL